jgi:hypothetical protein
MMMLCLSLTALPNTMSMTKYKIFLIINIQKMVPHYQMLQATPPQAVNKMLWGTRRRRTQQQGVHGL